MTFYQVTLARLRLLEAKWREVINRFRGPIPMGLAIVHMVAESNGDTDPRARDLRRRPIGLMQVPLRDATRVKYNETALKDPTTNIYVWTLITNQHAQQIKTAFSSWWTWPSWDFWCAVRLVWILGLTNTTNLFNAAQASGSEFASAMGSMAWVRTRMSNTQRFGTFDKRTLMKVADHLQDDVLTALNHIDGPRAVPYAFFDAPTIAPANAIARLANVS